MTNPEPDSRVLWLFQHLPRSVSQINDTLCSKFPRKSCVYSTYFKSIGSHVFSKGTLRKKSSEPHIPQGMHTATWVAVCEIVICFCCNNAKRHRLMKPILAIKPTKLFGSEKPIETNVDSQRHVQTDKTCRCFTTHSWCLT